MLNILYNLGAFVGGLELCLTVNEAVAGLADWFSDNRPPITEDNKSTYLEVFEHLQLCYLFCCALRLWSPTGIWLARQFVLGSGCWSGGISVGLLSIRERVVTLSVGLCGCCGGEIDAYAWSLVEVPEVIECFFGLVLISLVITGQ